MPRTPSDSDKPPGEGGGSVATRGFIVQALVALLDITQNESLFTEITLEPVKGGEQFDFVWNDGTVEHAVQVKSTKNSFEVSDVKRWAAEMKAVRTTEKCRLILAGNLNPKLVGHPGFDGVVIEQANGNIDGLEREAATLLALFLEKEGMDEFSASVRGRIVDSLAYRLLRLSIKSETLTREAFINRLREWINTAPKGPVLIDTTQLAVLKNAAAELIGREAETQLLDDAWLQAIRGEKERPRVLTFVAIGGEGKTSLVAKWAATLAYQGWPGCEAVFVWSFYSQGSQEQTAASSDLFIKTALAFFGDEEMAASSKGAHEKAKRLAALIAERRTLLILDGLEPLQYPPTSPLRGELRDPGLAALLPALAVRHPGLCVVTTRYSIPDLRTWWQTTAPEHRLPHLSTDAGVRLLRTLGVRERSAPRADFERVVEEVKGHALTLHLLGSWLRDAHAGDLRQSALVKLAEVNPEVQNGHAFRVMDTYVAWFESEGENGARAIGILRLLGLFDRPASAGCIAALKKEPVIPGLTDALVGMSETQRNVAFTRLADAGLLAVNRDTSRTLVSLDAHPLLREYFDARLREHRVDAWKGGHRRLYEYLCASTPDKPDAKLEDLLPLYQAVAHGCQAGLQQEACDAVYRDRIQRGAEAYSTRKLGALGSDLGAVACFFESPWSRVSPALSESAQAWLLNEAATRLRALGRLTEALEPMRVSGEMDVKVEQWEGAAISYSNLSELELTLGDVDGAVRDAGQSVTYADRSGDAFWKLASRATHADALHQAGQRAEAGVRFREAEQMQADYDSDHRLLYSLRGFQYCDLLLAEAERAAWLVPGSARVPRAGLGVPAETDFPEPSAMAKASLPKGARKEVRSGEDAGASTRDARAPRILAACRAVRERAAKTLKWVTGKLGLLDEALDHLTLGRAALYEAILAPSEIGNPKSEIEKAVDGLRSAGTQQYLPLGLLTRAWLRFREGRRTGPGSAHEDLEEARAIAERGPMPLHLADILLHRARLFGLRIADRGLRIEEGAYPWVSPQADLAEARRLIFQHGYLRRKEELDDAEAGLSSSSSSA